MGEDGRPKGFAVVTYADIEGVQAALKLDKSEHGSCIVDVKLESSFKSTVKPVIVKGVPDSVAVQTVRNHFANCGHIKRFFFTPPKDGSSRGKVAIITYAHQKIADEALKFDGTMFCGSRLVLKCGRGDGGNSAKDNAKGKGKGQQSKKEQKLEKKKEKKENDGDTDAKRKEDKEAKKAANLERLTAEQAAVKEAKEAK